MKQVRELELTAERRKDWLYTHLRDQPWSQRD